MTTYVVEWYIDIEADSPEDAARQALAIQRDPNSTATVFSVFDHDEDFGRSDDPIKDVDVLYLPDA
jgi:hypothetical protein